jgi:6,7-dimethyl-8-ribityllumazine synthase
MPRTLEGRLVAQPGMRFGLVVARFNELVTERLLAGALDGLARHGADLDAVDIARVPGSYEIPVAARAMAESGAYDAVAGEAGGGVGAIGRQTGVPCIFGVLTTETLEQALERAGGKAGNKGFEAAATAIEMANLMRLLKRKA